MAKSPIYTVAICFCLFRDYLKNDLFCVTNLNFMNWDLSKTMYYHCRYYGGRGYYAAGPANIKNIDYGKTEIKYNVKREAEADPEAHYYSYPVYSGYSTGYHFGVPYYGGYYRGYGCRNYLGSIVPCAEA